MANSTLKQMVFGPDARRVEIKSDESILDVAIRNRIPIEHSCGGMGSCGTCRVFVEKGLELFEPRNEVEQEIATDRDFKLEERLACQNQAFEGLEVRVPGQKRD